MTMEPLAELYTRKNLLAVCPSQLFLAKRSILTLLTLLLTLNFIGDPVTRDMFQ